MSETIVETGAVEEPVVVAGRYSTVCVVAGQGCGSRGWVSKVEAGAVGDGVLNDYAGLGVLVEERDGDADALADAVHGSRVCAGAVRSR
ncbi:hypothetical protein ACFCX0_24690 [Streptomyces sp. NPDC056352]|uniref:hypothetical protein n=1 Tax=Streptomyces sp. NPDC056352 TaxID=3345791 RepID=UPI0035D549B8